jgi:hypothetical protein
VINVANELDVYLDKLIQSSREFQEFIKTPDLIIDTDDLFYWGEETD